MKANPFREGTLLEKESEILIKKQILSCVSAGCIIELQMEKKYSLPKDVKKFLNDHKISKAQTKYDPEHPYYSWQQELKNPYKE